MHALPEITMVGTLTADPELRFTANGTAVGNLTVACNARRQNAAGEWEDGDKAFLRCTIWRDYAERVAESLTKGQRVIVCGRLKQSTYTKKDEHGQPLHDDDGNEVRRTVFDVTVDEIGPSLRWATATVQKATRSGGDSSGAAPSADEVWTQPVPAGASGAGDEPPF